MAWTNDGQQQLDDGGELVNTFLKPSFIESQ
jgi:hypothetical protein